MLLRRNGDNVELREVARSFFRVTEYMEFYVVCGAGGRWLKRAFLKLEAQHNLAVVYPAARLPIWISPAHHFSNPGIVVQSLDLKLLRDGYGSKQNQQYQRTSEGLSEFHRENLRLNVSHLQ